MFFTFGCLTKKSSLFSLLLNRQKTLTPSSVNWIMKRERSCSPDNKNRKRIYNMDSNNPSYKPSKRSSKVKQIDGDLFSCPETHSMAHCISADVEMGRGIAVKFKKEFGGVDELYYQRQGPGGLGVLERGQRYIYYLVTKNKYWEKPTYDDLYSSLLAMKNHNLEHGVKNLCMPKIGCGLDKLKWHEVLKYIRQIYQDSDVNITIYHYQEDSKGVKGSGGNPNPSGNQHKGDGQAQQANRSGNYAGKDGQKHQVNRSGNYAGKDGQVHQANRSGNYNGKDGQAYQTNTSGNYAGQKDQRQCSMHEYTSSQPAWRGESKSQENFPKLEGGHSRQGNKQNEGMEKIPKKSREDGSAEQKNPDKKSRDSKPVKRDREFQSRRQCDHPEEGLENQNTGHVEKKDSEGRGEQGSGSQNRSKDESQNKEHEKGRDSKDHKKRDDSRENGNQKKGNEKERDNEDQRKKDGSEDRSRDESQKKENEKETWTYVDHKKRGDGRRDRSKDENQKKGKEKDRDSEDQGKGNESRDRSKDENQKKGKEKDRDNEDQRKGNESRDRSKDENQKKGKEKDRDSEDQGKGNESRVRSKDESQKKEKEMWTHVDHKKRGDGNQGKSSETKRESHNKHDRQHEDSKNDVIVSQKSSSKKGKDRPKQAHEKETDTKNKPQEHQDDSGNREGQREARSESSVEEDCSSTADKEFTQDDLQKIIGSFECGEDYQIEEGKRSSGHGNRNKKSKKKHKSKK